MSEIDPETSLPSGRRIVRPARNARRARRRLAGVGVLAGVILAVLIVIALSLHTHLPFGLSDPSASSTHSGTTGPSGPTGPTRAPAGPAVTVKTLASLLAPASRVAAVPYGTGGALFLGGYDSLGSPTTAMQSFDGASVQAVGTLSSANASAGAVTLNASIYLIGGVSSTIYQVTPTSTTVAGSLPSATSDAATVAVGGTAYVIGGYSGTTELNTIVAYTPGSTPAVVATLPVALRLAAATAIRGAVYITGGESGGVATSAVYRFDPVTKTVSTFTHLTHARDREAATTLGGLILVLGGLDTATGARTRGIYSINPSNGSVHLAGILPVALSDMTAVRGDGQIIVAGGVGTTGAASSAIYGVRLTHR